MGGDYVEKFVGFDDLDVHDDVLWKLAPVPHFLLQGNEGNSVHINLLVDVLEDHLDGGLNPSPLVLCLNQRRLVVSSRVARISVARTKFPLQLILI